MVIFIALAKAFGYLLPWGNMSYWGAQVIVSLFGAIPYIGPDLMEWIRGDFLMSNDPKPLLCAHVVALPLVLCVLIFVHLVALHHRVLTTQTALRLRKTRMRTASPKMVFPSTPIIPCTTFTRWWSSSLSSAQSCSLRRRWAVTSWRSQILRWPIRSRRRNISRRYGTTRRSTQCFARRRSHCLDYLQNSGDLLS